jgi:hypothetical protein
MRVRWENMVPRSGEPSPRATRLGDQHLLQGVELLHALARTEHDAVKRPVGDDDRHAGLVPQSLVESAQQRTAAGQDDPAVHDVAGQLRRRAIQGGLDRIDDGVEGLVDRATDLLGGDHDGAWQAGDQVAAADLRMGFVRSGEG